jgi:hypothetical protein
MFDFQKYLANNASFPAVQAGADLTGGKGGICRLGPPANLT